MDHENHVINHGTSVVQNSSGTWWEGVSTYFSQADFMPHGHCYLWKPGLVYTHVISDFLIGSAYVAISLTLYGLVKKIKLPFSPVVLAFGVFIGACGWTHYNEIWNLWNSDYWYSGIIKVLTAVASVATGIFLWRLRIPIEEFAEAARQSEVHRLELVKLNEELVRQKEALVMINHELESFSYSVSHDLRAPLRGMDGFSQALIEDYSDKLTDEGRQYLNFIRQGTQQMGKVIDDLLNLSRISKTEIKSEEVDITSLAQGILFGLKDENPFRNVEVSIKPGLIARGDPGLIRLAMENLLSNAWKFTSKKEKGIIEVGQVVEDNRAVFFVKDNGAGFDMAHQNKLFGAFQRLHSPQEFLGTGVGLATVKRIIQRHGGSIWAQAKVGEGATFYFTLTRDTPNE